MLGQSITSSTGQNPAWKQPLVSDPRINVSGADIAGRRDEQMNAAMQRASARARAGQSASRVVGVSTFFVALLASSFLVGREVIARQTPAPVLAGQYRGVIEFPPNEQGRCEQLEFDNKTGVIRPRGTSQCSADTYVPSTESLGPLGGVRDYFRSR